MSNSMSMALTKESLTVDVVDGLRENNTSLINRNGRMYPVPPQRALKELNTSFAAAILSDPPETNQMTAERTGGRFRWDIGSHLFRRLATSARFESPLGTRNPRALPTPSNEEHPSGTVTASTSFYQSCASYMQDLGPSQDCRRRPKKRFWQSATSMTPYDGFYGSGNGFYAGGNGQYRLFQTAGQIPAERPEGRPPPPPTLQSHLFNDFKYVDERCLISSRLLSSFVRRFRILVVGKVRIIYQTDPRRN